MKNRIPMNSKSLQEAFPEVYRDFFSKCSTVVSAPGSFIWSGEYASLFGGFSISQNLPFRLYVGIEPVSVSTITSGIYKIFNSALRKFEDHSYDIQIRERIFKLLETKVKKNNKIEKSNGFVLHILSEVPTERGLNTSGAISAALALAMNLNYQAGFGHQEVEKWKKYSVKELSLMPDFDHIFRQAWKIESIYHAGVSSGRGAFVPFVDSYYPVLYFTEKRSGTYNPKEIISQSKPVDILDHYELVEKIKYWGFRLDEFFDINTQAYWPIDFGLIYSGYENSTASIIRMIPNIQEDFKEVATKIKDKFEQKVSRQTGVSSRFYEYCAREEGFGVWERIIETLGIISLKIASSFENLIRRGHSEEHFQDFFKALNQYQNVLHILEASTTSIDQICFSIYQRGRKLDIISGVGAKLTGAGHGGDVVFAAPIGIFRKSIEELIAEFRTNYNKEITLDYASWIDGFGEEGVKIEQHLDEKIFSSFISQGVAKVTHLNLPGWLHSDIYTLEEFETMKKKADILFDAINEEIYIRGQKLTSKEIHSAHTTIGIIEILLKNAGKKVRNDQFPESSYVRDRNECQSKIISPLTKVIYKKTGKKLPLKISGGLTDFFVALEAGEIDIYVLEKIF